MNGRLRTAREIAERLGVVPATVLRWTRNGDLPAHRMPGGAIRYDEDELDAWLAANATGAADRGVSATRTDRAHGSLDRLRFEASAIRPLEAARPEEDPYAS